MPMYTLGHDFVPPPVHAGGLRYHGDSPMVCGARPRGRDRGPRLQAERDLRGRRPVRPHRGHHPGARARPRDPRGDRGGRWRPRRPARSARSSSASAATATSTSPPTTPTWPERWRTRSSPRRTCRRRSRPCRRRPRWPERRADRGGRVERARRGCARHRRATPIGSADGAASGRGGVAGKLSPRQFSDHTPATRQLEQSERDRNHRSRGRLCWVVLHRRAPRAERP